MLKVALLFLIVCFIGTALVGCLSGLNVIRRCSGVADWQLSTTSDSWSKSGGWVKVYVQQDKFDEFKPLFRVQWASSIRACEGTLSEKKTEYHKITTVSLLLRYYHILFCLTFDLFIQLLNLLKFRSLQVRTLA